LTVVHGSKDGTMVPLGVIHASDLHKNILGTVSLRDFCNREETKIPSYLEVISVIDHHKSILQTSSPPVAIISDAQSSNALVARLAFEINDVYSSGGMTKSEIEKQMEEAKKDISSSSHMRILQRLLQRLMAIEKNHSYFVDPRREFVEYLHFLYAILDDTDLLTKVSMRDVECVASLLNRMKSILSKKEVEIVNFDDLKKDHDFLVKAAARIMQNEDMYSLYSKIYKAKENLIDQNLKLCIEKQPSTIFADTKEQNGCCRVGQTKMFGKNFPIFFDHADEIRHTWVEEAETFNKEKPEVDLHLQMISTIAGADDIFKGTAGKYTHKDEIWLWVPSQEQAIGHLESFLNAFKSCPQVVKNQFEVEFLGDNAEELQDIFKEAFLSCPMSIHKEKNIPIAVLHFNAGTLNSRKAMISPYLPRLIN
jgi:hypothetical protein